MSESWEAFTKTVDSPEASPEFQKAASDFFSGKGYPLPLSLAGLMEAEFAAMSPPEGPQRAFLRRCIYTATAVANAKMQRAAQPPAAAPPLQPLGGGVHGVPNGSMSALQLAQAVSGTPQKEVDVNKVLKDAGLGSLASSLQPEAAVFQLMQSDNDAAAKAVPARSIVFTYVELTSKEVLPL